MTANKWLVVFLIVVALVAVGVLLNDASRRYNFERDRAYQAIQQQAGDNLTATARAGN